MKAQLLFVSCCIMVFLVVACAGCATSREAEATASKANMERARGIIEALTEYKQDNGQFPEGIDELVPAYLVEIPETAEGRSFDYEPNELEGYYLCFYLNRKRTIGCCYIHRLEFWDCFRNVGD